MSWNDTLFNLCMQIYRNSLAYWLKEQTCQDLGIPLPGSFGSTKYLLPFPISVGDQAVSAPEAQSKLGDINPTDKQQNGLINTDSRQPVAGDDVLCNLKYLVYRIVHFTTVNSAISQKRKNVKELMRKFIEVKTCFHICLVSQYLSHKCWKLRTQYFLLPSFINVDQVPWAYQCIITV